MTVVPGENQRAEPFSGATEGIQAECHFGLVFYESRRPQSNVHFDRPGARNT